ncbi:MAG TPA: hypothetical protein VFR02_03205, partial [bacterium]|nr:hypothetical protein [bacterium]
MKKTIVCVFLAGWIPMLALTGCANNGGGTGPSAHLYPFQKPQAMVSLGSAASYGILAYSAITNSGPTTLCGSLGIAPLSSVSGGIV